MLLPLPNLDDRRWSDLAEEGRNLIPRYAPEWTDFNVHDPGITLIELFAWVAEMDIFRLNRIPESHRRKFLALLGITPQPPLTAKTVVQFSLNNGAPWIDLPATTEIEMQENGSAIRFRTLEALAVVPVKLETVWREDQNGLQNLTTLWENGETLPMFGDIPKVGSAFYFGFSEPLPEGKTVTLYLRFTGCKSGAEERQRLQEEWLAAQQDCPAFNPCQPENSAASTATPMDQPHHSARTVWEVGQSISDRDSWRTLNAETGEVIDETRACTLDGFVRITLPAPMSLPSANPYPYLRCRVVAGEYDAPPSLQAAIVNAVAAEQAAPVSTEFVIAKNATISYPPTSLPVSFEKFILHFNAAGEIDALNFLLAASEAPKFFITRFPAESAPGVFGCELRLLGKGLDEPSQEVVLQPAPVQAHSVEVFTLEGAVWQAWSRRPDFDASSRSDRHFLLDATTGTVTFGNGEKGLPVPRGALIIAKFRTTRAERGNFPAGKKWLLSSSAHNQALLIDVATTRAELQEISNPFPATGGTAAEDLAHAEGRALEEVSRVTRAVTTGDIEHLALTTPGTCVARVAVKPNLDARYPCLQAPGVTTVILLPQIAAPGAQPSLGLRAAVQRYLDRRRILGNRIVVVGPVYTKVTVRARVQSQTGANPARVQRDILQGLSDFFDPLHGGPEKTGWPFGRDVYRSEVLYTIDSVAGVENVVSLELIANDGEPSCLNLCIGPCGLVISGEHEINVD